MDPGLEEAIRRTPSLVEIEAIALLRPGYHVPSALRVVTTFGRIVTCRIPAGEVRAVRADPAVASLKAARVVEPAAAIPAEAGSTTSRLHPRSPGTPTGRGVVIACLDWGCDVAHPAFRRADGGTRLIALWDQRHVGTGATAPYGYGRVLSRARIDAALSKADPYAELDYHPAISDPLRVGAHGTHVMSVAAGSASAPDGAAGVAPEADLVFVHLATGAPPAMGDLGDSVRILEALDFVRRVAGALPWVGNLSLGRTGGDHSGRSLVEMAMDHLVEEAPGRAIVQSAGNYFDKRMHAEGRVRPGGSETVEWWIAPGDPTLNELEIWYSGRDSFRLELSHPGAGDAWVLDLGERAELVLNGRTVGRAYHRRREPATGDHHIDVFLEPGAPAGAWQVRLNARDVVDGRFHAWIERDARVPGAQSRFSPGAASSRSTLGTIANGYRTLVVGAYGDGNEGLAVAPFSSSGPTRDGRAKPDLLAPGVGVVAARSTPADAPPGSGGVTAMSGTSMAAPHVSGAVALLFSAARSKLDAHETRALVVGTAAPAPRLDPERAGNGLLDPRAAIAALAARQEAKMTRESTFDEIESAAPFPSPHAARAFVAALRVPGTETLPDLRFVAGPGTAPEGGIHDDDVIVRVSPGEPVPPLVGRIASGAAWSAGGDAEAEYGPPGYYARVVPVASPAWAMPRARRVLDARGRLPANTVLLRPRPVPVVVRGRVIPVRPTRPPFPVFRAPARTIVTPFRPAPPPLWRPPAAAPPPPPPQLLEPAEPGYGAEPPYEPLPEEPFAPAEPGLDEPPGEEPFVADEAEPDEELGEEIEFAELPEQASQPAAQQAPDLRTRIVQVALREWNRWGQGSRTETDPAMRDTLRGYWLAVSPNAGAADDAIARGAPWSAAFISWVIREAGGGDAFTASARHTVYVAAAKRARLQNDRTKFWAYDIAEATPEVGDLVCRDRRPREGAPCAGTTYQNVDDGAARPSHSDVVTEVTAGHLVCVGGNVGDSVDDRRVRLDGSGHVVRDQGGCRFFALVKPPRAERAVAVVPSSTLGSLATLPASIAGAVRAGLLTLEVGVALAMGNRNVKELTNRVFHARHPELGGRSIRPDEEALAREWLDIRDRLVRPLVESLGGGAAAGAGGAAAAPSPSVPGAQPRRVSRVEDLVTRWDQEGERARLGNAARDLRHQNDFNDAIFRAQDAWELLDPFVLKSMLAQESSFRPGIVNSRGFAGVAQLGMEEARSVGLSTGRSPEQTREQRGGRERYPVEQIDRQDDQRLQPEVAIPAAARLLRLKARSLERKLFPHYGTPRGDDYHRFVLGAYNAGQGTVLNAARRQLPEQPGGVLRFDQLDPQSPWARYADQIVARARQA